MNEITMLFEDVVENEMETTEYFEMGKMGILFRCKLSGISFGKLLQVVGLADIKNSITTPLNQYIPEYAIHSTYTQCEREFPYWLWHKEKCKSYIDKWLKENNFYDTFYSLRSEKSLVEYISKLHKHVKSQTYGTLENFLYEKMQGLTKGEKIVELCKTIKTAANMIEVVKKEKGRY